VHHRFGASYNPSAVRGPLQAALFNCIPLPVTLAPTAHPGAALAPSQPKIPATGRPTLLPTKSARANMSLLEPLNASTSGAATVRWSGGPPVAFCVSEAPLRSLVQRLWANCQLGAALCAGLLVLLVVPCQ
jgi:hypothetical protein